MPARTAKLERRSAPRRSGPIYDERPVISGRGALPIVVTQEHRADKQPRDNRTDPTAPSGCRVVRAGAGPPAEAGQLRRKVCRKVRHALQGSSGSFEVQIGDLLRSAQGRREPACGRVLGEMARPGLEPGTPRFSVVCSTN